MQALLGALGLGEDAFAHGNSLRWNEIDFFLKQRQLRVDILANARDDLQDIIAIDEDRLDTNLVVVTLLLVFGFGFVVEGTFPNRDDQPGWRVVYAAVAGLSLVCPFWAMLGYLECRNRLTVFRDNFNKHFHDIVKMDNVMFLERAASARDMSDDVHHMVRRLPSITRSLSVGRVMCCTRRAPSVPASVPALQASAETLLDSRKRVELCQEIHKEYVQWWDQWCNHLNLFSNVLFRLGAFFNVLCAALLLGLYFRNIYPDTPWVWRSYVLLVMLGIIAAVMATIVLFMTGPVRAVERLDSHPDSSTSKKIPMWMRRPLIERSFTSSRWRSSFNTRKSSDHRPLRVVCPSL